MIDLNIKIKNRVDIDAVFLLLNLSLWKILHIASNYKLTVMAEVQQAINRQNKGGRRSKKLSTKIDLTPMVDLGFLLITFFIFTTSMTKPKALGLILPDDKPTALPTIIPESKTLSLILEGNDKLSYYFGNDIGKLTTTDYSIAGLRTVIQQKQLEIRQQFPSNPNSIVLLVKPTEASTYENLVKVLDEIVINNVKYYFLMEPSKEEKALAYFPKTR